MLEVDAGPDKTVYPGYKAANRATLTASTNITKASHTFKWSNGATSQYVEVSPEVTTSYTVTATDPSGCSSTDEVTVFVDDSRCGKNGEKIVVCHKGKSLCVAQDAVEDHLAHGDAIGDCGTEDKKSDAKKPQEFSVYPNPMGTKAQVTLRLQEQDYITLDILDMDGKVVQQLYRGTAAANEKLNFDIKRSIGNQSMYVARLTTSQGTEFIKIVMEK
nr:T9SS type A sorting domain-containing protein [Pontibacter sp. E15-1]